MAGLVPVRFRGCECPGTPHKQPVTYANADKPIAGDVAFLTPKLSYAGGLIASADISNALGRGDMLKELWTVTFVRYGCVAWNLVDEDGDPVPFDVEVLLDDYDLAVPVAEKADDLYGDTVSRPFLQRIRSIGRRGPTKDLISPTKKSPSKPRARSSRATTAGTRRSTA
jgi:hypothetical protein